MQHVYNPEFQNQNLASRTTAALDKISDVFKSLLWESQKQDGLSPLQQKLLIFIAYHDLKHNTVSNLVEEFSVTKATVSECIKTLETRKWILKKLDLKDNRRFYLQLTDKGTEKVNSLTDFSTPVQKALSKQNPEHLNELYSGLYELLRHLEKQQITSVQRSCMNCKAYRSGELNYAFCMELRIQLPPENRRIDCPEYLPKK